MLEVLFWLFIFLAGAFIGPAIRRLLPDPARTSLKKGFEQINGFYHGNFAGEAPIQGIFLASLVLILAAALIWFGTDESSRNMFLFTGGVLVLGMICGPGVRKLLPGISRKWLDAVYTWLSKFWAGRTEAPEIKAGDLIGLAALAATAIAIFYGVRDASLQATKESLTSETRQLREQVATQLEQIGQQGERIQTLETRQTVPQLIRPGADANLIGHHVDLAWEYRGHTSFVNYLVQFMRLPTAVNAANTDPRCQDVQTGTLLKLYPATDPGGRRSRLPYEIGKELCPGTYYWRVLPVGFTNTSPSDLQARLSDWSAFASFTVYSTIKERIFENSEVLVGTNFVQDTQFSRRGFNGRAEGYDIDLITLIVEGCLDPGKKIPNNDKAPSYTTPIYNHDRCSSAVTTYLQHCENDQNQITVEEMLNGVKKLNARIVPITDFGDWAGRLQKKEIDMFIGTATKAEAREQGDIRFSAGYFSYRTMVVVKANDPCDKIACLVGSSIRIGVIQGTTNHKLAELLKEETKDRMEIVPFPSFPALENALDDGDVRAIIIDSILTEPMIAAGDFRDLPGIEKEKAWTRYMNEYIHGEDKEEFGVAIALDSDDRGHKSEDTLLGQFDKALQSKEIDEFKACLSRRFLEKRPASTQN